MILNTVWIKWRNYYGGFVSHLDAVGVDSVSDSILILFELEKGIQLWHPGGEGWGEEVGVVVWDRRQVVRTYIR